jgi:parallel beta-helix repeat protein
VKKTAFLFFLVFLAGCSSLSATKESEGRELHWSGEVRLDKTLTLARGTNLTIAPGTVVRLGWTDSDGDGLGDTSIHMEGGKLTSLGTPEAPIIFTTGEAPAYAGRWGELRVDFGTVDIRYTVLEGSTRGLHLHFCSGLVEDSVLRQNHDGTRIGESTMVFRRCLFSGQEGKGFNSRASRNLVENCLFRNNKRGIFLFEGDEGSVFRDNIFTGNDIPFRLGDFYEGELKLAPNRWDDPTDQYRPEGSTATVEFAHAPVAGAGPEKWPLLSVKWKVPMEGYADALAADESGVYAVSFGGELKRLALFDGSVLASAKMPDTLDSPPARGRVNNNPRLAVQCWNRGIYLLDGETLKELGSFSETSSPADDHRQSGPLIEGSRLFAATWAGKVRGFGITGGGLERLWEFTADGPFRADLSMTGRGELLAPSEDGTLYALGTDGSKKWEYRAGAPLLSGAETFGEKIFFADKGGTIHALGEGGKLLWRSALSCAAWYARPLLAEGTLYQGDDDGGLSAFDPASGALLYRVRLEGGIRSRPAFAEGTLAVATAKGFLYLLRAADGFILDRLEIGESALASPVALGKLLFAASRPGTVFGLNIERAEKKN